MHACAGACVYKHMQTNIVRITSIVSVTNYLHILTECPNLNGPLIFLITGAGHNNYYSQEVNYIITCMRAYKYKLRVDYMTLYMYIVCYSSYVHNYKLCTSHIVPLMAAAGHNNYYSDA